MMFSVLVDEKSFVLDHCRAVLEQSYDFAQIYKTLLRLNMIYEYKTLRKIYLQDICKRFETVFFFFNYPFLL